MNLWEKVKDKETRSGDLVTLRRRQVMSSPSGRRVFEYEVIYLATDRTVSRGMSRRIAMIRWDMEVIR